MIEGRRERPSFRLMALRSTDWARRPLHKVYALQIVEQKKKNLQRTTAAQKATRTSRRRNRESKHRYSVSVWQGCWKGGTGSKFEAMSPDHTRPLFGGSRPLTAQKGVQAAGKGGQSEVRCRWTLFWRIQAAHGTKRGPAARKWNGGSWKFQIEAARPLFDRFGPLGPQKGVQQPEKSKWSKATLLDPFLQDFGYWAVKKEPRKL